MTLAWSLLIIVGVALGTLVVAVAYRLIRDQKRTGRRRAKRIDPAGNTTIAHYGHS